MGVHYKMNSNDTEINEAYFMNLSMHCVGLGILPTGERNWKLAQEYAKQQATEFMDWLEADYSHSSGEWEIYESDCGIKPGKYTTEQLYEIYFESKKQ